MYSSSPGCKNSRSHCLSTGYRAFWAIDARVNRRRWIKSSYNSLSSWALLVSDHGYRMVTYRFQFRAIFLLQPMALHMLLDKRVEGLCEPEGTR